MSFTQPQQVIYAQANCNIHMSFVKCCDPFAQQSIKAYECNNRITFNYTSIPHNCFQ